MGVDDFLKKITEALTLCNAIFNLEKYACAALASMLLP
jgi:hypothetical protein